MSIACWRPKASRRVTTTMSTLVRPRHVPRRCLAARWMLRFFLPPSNFQVQNQGYNDLGLAMKYAPELAFSGTVVNKAWAARSADALKRVLAAQNKSIEYLYDAKNRADVVRILVKVSGQKMDDVEKSYDFFNNNNFFDRTGKISRPKMNALIDALVGLGDVKTPGNIERFLLPGVAQLTD